MPINWTTQDIVALIKFINFIWRKIEKTEERLDETEPLENLETKLQHLSESLEYLRRETEHEKSILVKEGDNRREVGILLGQLSVDLNVLDIMVSKMKGGLGVDEENFEGLQERLDMRMLELNSVLETARRHEQRGGLGWALHGVSTSFHHVHWSDLVEVRYPKDEFYLAQDQEPEILKLDLRKDEGFDDDCITIFVQFQDNGFGTKIGKWRTGGGVEVTAPRGTSLGELKKALRELIEVPIYQQLLSHRGVMLDNGASKAMRKRAG
ncbi:uncharacterized protein PAC_16787 [Phialocephala subalpina]|uniref:Ubiquitin-like domain-containing protein n=1 Tax=Phialocephala subalpina TaxID=576137 RepID=A0A1L7XPM9_9HELO|nr:uncharacterized protein PAC_16787 [Phialocephala subalpina]